MDPVALGKLIAAANVSASAAPSPAELRGATEFYTQFKTRQDAHLFARYILDTPAAAHTDAARHLSLQLLADFVSTRWNKKKAGKLSPEDKLRFRELVMGGAVKWLRPTADEAPFVKRGLAKLIADLARRTWPQQWLDFPKQIEALLTTGGAAQVELAANVLADVAEAGVAGSLFLSTMAPRRRKEVMKSVNDSAPVLLNAMLAKAQPCFAAVTRGADPQALAVLKAILQAFIRYSTFLEPAKLEAYHFVPMFAAALKLPATQETAMEGIITLTGRQGFKDASAAYKFRVAVITTLVPLLRSILDASAVNSDGSVNSAVYGFQCSAVYALATTADSTLPQLCKDAAGDPGTSGAALALLVSTMEAAYKFPSLVVRLALVPCWKMLLTNIASPRPEAITKVLPAVMMYTGELMEADPYFLQPDDAPEVATPWSPYLTHDFLDRQDYKQAVSLGVAQAGLLLRVMALSEPVMGADACVYLADQCRTAVAALLDAAAPPLEFHSPQYLGVSAKLKALSAVVAPCASIANKDATAADVKRAIHERLGKTAESVVSWANPRQPALLSLQPAFFKAIGGMFKALPALVKPVMDRLLAGVTFTLPPGRHAPGSLPFRLENKVRGESAAALRDLASGQAITLTAVDPDSCRRVSALAYEDTVRVADRVVLLRAVVSLGNAMPKEALEAFLTSLLADPVTYWCGPEVTKIVSSSEGLANFTRGVEGIPFTVDLEALPPAHSKFVGVLHLFAAVARHNARSFRSGAGAGAGAGRKKKDKGAGRLKLIADMWVRILPNLCQLMVSLHRLWDPAIRAGLLADPFYCWTLAPAPAELTEACNTAGVEMEATWDDTARTHLLIPQFLYKVRMACLELIMMAASHGDTGLFAPAEPCIKSLQLLRSGLVESLAFTRPRHLPALLSVFVLGVLKGTPFGQLAVMLPALSGPALTYTTQVMRDLWSGAAAVVAAPVVVPAGAGAGAGAGGMGGAGAAAVVPGAPAGSDPSSQGWSAAAVATGGDGVPESVVDLGIGVLAAHGLDAGTADDFVTAAHYRVSSKLLDIRKAFVARPAGPAAAVPAVAPAGAAGAASDPAINVALNACDGFAGPLFGAMVQVLAVPKGTTFTTALLVWKFLIARFDVRKYGEAIGRDLFSALITLLLQGRRWAVESEIAVLRLCAELYTRYVLHPTTPLEVRDRAYPRHVLLALPGATIETVNVLEGKMRDAMGSSSSAKKKRRGPPAPHRKLKSFLQAIIVKASPLAGSDGMHAPGSILRQAPKKVANMPEQLMVFARRHDAAVIQPEDVSTTGLFGSSDDEL